MQYFFTTRLGNTRYELADGSLLCKDVPIARTGLQVYGAHELDDIEADSDGEIVVSRNAEEVFSTETLASFEGMTLTILHPEEMVNPGNWADVAQGHIQNVRRGTGEQSDLMLADIFVKNVEAIKAIYGGLDELSCGYDAEYRQTAKGKAEQYDIVGNHTALVPNGRAGKRCSIGDSVMASKTKKGWFDALKRAIKTKDEAAIEEVMDSAPDELTKDEGGGLPQTINIHLPPQQPLPDKAPEMNGGITTDDDGDLAALVKSLIARMDKLEGGGTKDSNPDDEEEAKKATTDAAYHQDVISRAEILIPGVAMPEGGKLSTFKRSVLDAAYRTEKGSKILSSIVGQNPDFKAMPKPVLDAAFVAASEIAKAQNKPAVSFGISTKDSAKNSPQALNQAFGDFWKKG